MTRTSVRILVFLLVFAAGGASAQITEGRNDIVLRFGGDVLLGGAYQDAAGDSVSLAFRGFDGLSIADVAMVNLENPVTTRGTRVPKPFNFRMHPRFVRALTEAGIDIVTLANNHVFDYGNEGLFDTISYLDSAGVKHVGAGGQGKENWLSRVLWGRRSSGSRQEKQRRGPEGPPARHG